MNTQVPIWSLKVSNIALDSTYNSGTLVHRYRMIYQRQVLKIPGKSSPFPSTSKQMVHIWDGYFSTMFQRIKSSLALNDKNMQRKFFLPNLPNMTNGRMVTFGQIPFCHQLCFTLFKSTLKDTLNYLFGFLLIIFSLMEMIKSVGSYIICKVISNEIILVFILNCFGTKYNPLGRRSKRWKLFT